MSASIDIAPAQMRTINALLDRYLPGVKVWAYGSRVTGAARPDSDLDMVVFADLEQLPAVSALREAFEESNLPFRVDLFEWNQVPATFRKTIEAKHAVVRSGNLITGAYDDSIENDDVQD